MSLVAHCGVASVLFLGPDPAASRPADPAQPHNYAVLMLRLDYPLDPPPEEKQAGRTPTPENRETAPQTPGAESTPAAVLRPFVLPPVPRQDPVKQTIVRLDVPPEIQLHREIPLPTVLLGVDRLPPRKFIAPSAATPAAASPAATLPSAPQVAGGKLVAPTNNPDLAPVLGNVQLPVRAFVTPAGHPTTTGTPKPAVNLPGAPELAGAHPVVTVSDPALAALLASGQLPLRAFVAPAALSPQAPKPAPEIPAAPQSAGTIRVIATDPNLAAVLQRGDRLPTRTFQAPPPTTPGKTASVQLLALPPHVTVPDPKTSTAVGLLSLPDVPVYVTVAAVPPANQVAASVLTGGGGGARTGSPGASSDKNPASTQAAGNSREDLPLPGTTRLNFPKDGKFGAVVLGSSTAAPYIESIGALSGKLVYSVFVGVGLHKKWILQYSLPKAEEQKNAEKGRAEALEAPWPYYIVRPDQIDDAALNYVIVRGALTAEGRFDQLALLYPAELPNSDLLMRALKQWQFRPATRDGVPAAVEILLIIPNQTE